MSQSERTILLKIILASYFTWMEKSEDNFEENKNPRGTMLARCATNVMVVEIGDC